MTGRSFGIGSCSIKAETAALVGVAVLSLAAYAFIFLPFLPKADGTGGSDYAYFVPQLLAGYYWSLQNGPFAVPWFTPAFCAGMPYYGNMQGLYFSLPQFLTFVIGPTNALQVTFLTFAAAGMGGFYALARKVFGIGRWIALAAGVLFLFNGFFAARFLIGHLTFHAFMLVPLLALCVFPNTAPGARPGYFDIRMLSGTLILAYMVQSGMVHALPPSLLGIGAIILIHGYVYGLRPEPFMRLAVMGTIALLISAAKLAAAAAFLTQFPRNMIPLSGFGSIVQSAAVALQSLFISPAVSNGTAWLLNNEWYPGINISPANHEYEYGVSNVPAIIILTWLITLLAARLRGHRTAANLPRRFIVSILAILFIIPVLLNWYEPAWHGMLKNLPLIGSSSTLLRWFCFYIPPFILVSILIVDRAKGIRFKPPDMALAIVASVVIANLAMSRQYYVMRTDYDFKPVEIAYANARQNGSAPAVNHVVWPRDRARRPATVRTRNNALVQGATNAQCYEPMFGHRLEDYPYTALREGPTLEARDGLLNVKNPACMQYPDANECRPGDQFAESDRAAAVDFLNYRPFPFRVPWWQKLANAISLVSLTVIVLGIAVSGVRRFRLPRYQQKQIAP